MLTGTITVAAFWRPMSMTPDVRFQAGSGETLAALLARCDPPAWFGEAGTAALYRPGMREPGQVDREHWRRVRPKPGTVVVFSPDIQGGGKGKSKDMLTTIASLAVLAASLAIPQFGIPLLGTWFQAGALGARLLGAAVGVVGSLAVKALAPPPIAKNIEDGPAVPEIAGYGGNPLGRGAALPCVLGRDFTASPPFLAYPYTTFENGESYVHGIVGLWGRHSVRNIKINRTDSALITGLEMEVREGLDDDLPITVAPLTVREDRSVGQLSEFKLQRAYADRFQLKDQDNPQASYPRWHASTPGTDADRLRITILAPSSFSRTGDSDKQICVPVRFQFRREGDATWINGPEVHLSDPDTSTREIRQTITLHLGKKPPNYGVAIDEDRHCFAVLGRCGNAAWSWVPDPMFQPGAGFHGATSVNVTDDGADIYCESLSRGSYEIRIMRGMAYRRSLFDPATYSWNGTANIRFFDVDETAGPFVVPEAQRDMVSPLVCEVVQAVRDDYPIRARGLTLIGIRARGIQLESISADFTAWAETWDGTSWGAAAETDNPAALYRRVLQDYHAFTGLLPPQRIGDAVLGAWSEHCVSEGLTCNMVADGLTLPDMLQTIASAGHAIPRQGETWDVVYERDRSAETPVQLIVPANGKPMMVDKQFDQIPHALAAEFKDASRGYRLRDDVIRYRPGYGPETATNIRTIRYVTVDNELEARKRLRLDMGQMIHRNTEYRVPVWIEGLLSRRGDLVDLAMPTLGERFGGAAVARVLKSGGTITGLVLDHPVVVGKGPGDLFSMGDLFSGDDVFADTAASAIVLRRTDRATLALNITETEGTWQRITLEIPLADDGRIEAGCLLAIGTRGTATIRCLVTDIRRTSFEAAEMLLRDAAPQIMQGGL